MNCRAEFNSEIVFQGARVRYIRWLPDPSSISSIRSRYQSSPICLTIESQLVSQSQSQSHSQVLQSYLPRRSTSKMVLISNFLAVLLAGLAASSALPELERRDACTSDIVVRCLSHFSTVATPYCSSLNSVPPSTVTTTVATVTPSTYGGTLSYFSIRSPDSL